MAQFNVGDQVIRKSGRRVIGTIKSVSASSEHVCVTWHNALRPFSGGYSDNHSWILASSLVPATTENVAKMQQQIAGKNAKLRATQATYRYCPGCHTRYFEGDAVCARCGRRREGMELDVHGHELAVSLVATT